MDKMLVEKSFHRFYSVPSGTLCKMEKIHISYLTARKKYDISIFYQHFVPDGTKIKQDYTTFDCAVLRKFFPVGNFVVHPNTQRQIVFNSQKRLIIADQPFSEISYSRIINN
jgi:hypothetical protein